MALLHRERQFPLGILGILIGVLGILMNPGGVSGNLGNPNKGSGNPTDASFGRMLRIPIRFSRNPLHSSKGSGNRRNLGVLGIPGIPIWILGIVGIRIWVFW